MITAYLLSACIATITVAAYSKSFYEMRYVTEELSRLRSYAAAEGGIQNAMAQIGSNAYTAFINTNPISITNFQATDGGAVGSYSVAFDYPNQADWVTITATATVNGQTRNLEGRVFLDSNLSKYLVYAETSSFASGTNAQYGEPDLTDAYGDGTPDYPEFVPANTDDRASLYFTGTWGMTGSNVQTYGDANAQGTISGDASSKVHGDIYASPFSLNANGSVQNSGVSGALVVNDGFADDADRNGSGAVTSADAPDRHDLTNTGGGDSHKTETLKAIDNSFYVTNNNTPQFAGASAQSRYLKFVPTSNGLATQIVEYTNANFSTVAATYNLPASAIVYVKGNTYVQGEIGGRVSVVSSNSIYFDGNTRYAAGQNKADANHSMAFMAKDRLFFRANDLTVSGILYGENSSNSTAAFDATYNTAGQSAPSSKVKLRLYGNRVMKGSTNLSIYPDRVYGYDGNLKYYRPPGIPVVPSLRTVREK